MYLLLVFISIIIIVYGILIFWIWSGFKQGFQLPFPNNDLSNYGISIVIAARNEASHIQACIESILKNNFPEHLYEVIIIDDHSTDQTYELVKSFAQANVTVITLPEGVTGKKNAIQYAINLSKYEIILCTDADGVVEKQWIAGHYQAYQNERTTFCTGIVLPNRVGTALFDFQWLDFASTMAITANGIYRKQYFLANGANMSFRKSAFLDIQGFEQNKDRASGDDIFLIQNLAKQHDIGFISFPFAKVYTKSEPSWKGFFIQRKRWATKALASPDTMVMKIQGFVFLVAIITIVTLLLTLVQPQIFGLAFAILVLGKMAVDYVFLHKVSLHFGRQEAMKSFFASFLMYYIHILYSGWHATFPSHFQWKSRTAK
jgi:cellulose synthase/poly-beta-1,6-N-acetylglucosamine synthase-like glycosyltransferase